MKSKILLSTLMLGILCASCSNRVYNNKAFLNQNSIEGKTVAILPVEVLLTGKLPKGMTDKQKIREEEKESKFFQEMFYAEYLDKAKSYKKNKYAVEFLNPAEINSKLSNASITAKNIGEVSAEELAKITGADLVFLVKVKKNRLMSDGAAIGIDVAEGVLNSILNPKGNNDNFNTGATKTHNLSFDATLIDGASGTTISKLSNFKEATWKENPEKIIQRNYSKVTRKSLIYVQR